MQGDDGQHLNTTIEQEQFRIIRVHTRTHPPPPVVVIISLHVIGLLHQFHFSWGMMICCDITLLEVTWMSLLQLQTVLQSALTIFCCYMA